jgi:dTDP-4-amino-4,6-dideoxygalactose transaminase
MDLIMTIANNHGLKVVEDAAQAIGSKYKSKPSGSIGDVGCFSTHPLKNLNACGDGGFLTTNDEKIYLKAKALRNHGMADRDRVDNFGYVSRMDNLQAAILNYRLNKLEEIIEKRRNNAQLYFANIQNESVYLPIDKEYEFNTWHTFVIQTEKRNQLQKYLSEIGINTAVHYPVPIHLQPASKKLGYRYGDFPIVEKQAKSILTLPINQYLKSDEVKFISDKTDNFFKAIS